MTEVEERPQKRARLDESASSLSDSAPIAPPKASANGATEASTAPIRSDTDLEREIRAGITEYVSPDNLGFTGVLKQRYTDFLVNEILPNGEVLHLRSTGVPKKEKAKNGTAKKVVEAVVKDTPLKEEGNVAEQKAAVKPEASGGDVESKPQDVDGEEILDTFKVSEEDVDTLNGIFGEETTTKVVALVKSIRKHPHWKAKDFTAVTGPPITDKDTRTQAHRTLRRIFPNMLESAMEPDQSIRIKATPPAERGNKRKRGNEVDRDRNQDSMRGSLAWEERGGEYLHFTLYKENKDTMEVVGFLGSQTGGSKSYSFAGTKDRRACTVQRVCVKRQSAERMTGVGKKLFNGAIGDYEYKNTDLGLGDLMGNEFTISLRDCHFQKEDGLDLAQRLQLAENLLSQAVKDFSEKGFLNYYGLQRFGSFAASTDAIGKKLLQNDLKGAVDDILTYSEVALAAAKATEEDSKVLVSQDDKARAKALDGWRNNHDGGEALQTLPKKYTAERNIIQHLSSRNGKTKRHDRLQDWQGALQTIPRNLRLMYVHAYQSLVWNVVAGKRWTLFGDKVVEGDLVLVHEHKDKEQDGPTALPDTVDQDGEMIINPAGSDSANPPDDAFERARPLSAAEAASGKYNIFDVVLPQPGFDVEYPKNEIGEFYKEFMGSEAGGGLDPYNMRRKWREVSLSGGYRKFLARPLEPISFEVKEYSRSDAQLAETDLQRLRKAAGDGARELNGGVEVENVDDETGAEEKKIAVILKLQLGSSQYATMALRELMKAGGVKVFKPEFMGGR
jgi:tRNA pseudouridine13 synthase